MVCLRQILAESDPRLWATLPESPTFTSAQNRRAFSRNAAELRGPLPPIQGIYAEAHYSANSIRDNLTKLLTVLGIEERVLRIYLRQDRAARADVA